MDRSSQESIPDLRQGIALDALEPGRPVAGRVGDEPVLLVRDGDVLCALDATCPHYGAPLAEGLVVDGVLRCPWHHARFSLRTGEVLAPPALDDLRRWHVDVRDGRAVVERLEAPAPLDVSAPPEGPGSVVIVGAGAAGTVAAMTLRKEGHRGALSVIDPDPDAPYDRPNLSKDYLAGAAPEDWLPLRPEGFWEAHDVDRRVDAVRRIDTAAGEVELAGGARLYYDALLLATGARPLTLPLPGAELGHVLTLRSLADCRRLIEALEPGREAVVVGSGFIGMEAAAALRARGLGVSVVSPDIVPFQRALGADLGRLVGALHAERGVRFRFGRTLAAIDASSVTLDDGSRLGAHVVLVAVGVEPDTRLAEKAGLRVDDGVIVDAHLATSAAGVWAAGDAARFPDPRTGATIRIEHWVVAERQGQVAARNILGQAQPFDDVPFFWTRQYETTIAYVGHAARWDEVRVEGDLAAGDGVVRYVDGGEVAAVATVGRDLDSLRAEVELGRRVDAAGDVG